MKVVWSPGALQDRADIWEYVAQDDQLAAVRLDALFSEAAQRLSKHPMLGRPGMIEGTRELIPHKSYRLVYEIHQEKVWILALAHTARLWPPVREE